MMSDRTIAPARGLLAASAAVLMGAALVAVPASGAAAATSDGLVGSWRMDETSGSAVTDSAGNNNGTFAGTVTRIPGKLGSGALDFAGGRVTIPDSPDLDLTGKFSVAAWVRPDTITTSSVVRKSAQNATDGYELGLSNNGTAFFRLNQLAQPRDVYRVDSGTGVQAIVAGQWAHLVGVYDGSTMNLYVNGVARTPKAGPAAVATNDLPLTIGAQPGGSSAMDGAVDSVHIYNRALNAAEVTELMNADPAPPAPADPGAPGDPGSPKPSQPTEQSYGFFLNDSWSSKANHVFAYGRSTDEVFAGDWNNDGKDTITLRRGNTFYVSNAQQGGNAEKVITYGRPGDVILVGDWDGDGTDTFAVRRGNAYHIKNSMAGGPADKVVYYGKAGDEVVVGDWDGKGGDTLAVRRGNVYHVKNSISGGPADRVIAYGRATDIVLAGDWDGKNGDSFAVRRGHVYHVKNSISGGPADLVQSFGRVSDEVYVGDWNGDDRDTLGVRRLP